jgi:hypothetical protein
VGRHLTETDGSVAYAERTATNQLPDLVLPSENESPLTSRIRLDMTQLYTLVAKRAALVTTAQPIIRAAQASCSCQPCVLRSAF